MTSPQPTRTGQRRVPIENFWLDALTEREVVDTVRESWAAGQGGSVIPVNVDVARAVKRQPDLAELLTAGSIVVADGMPLLWATRAAGQVLPERVAGSALLFSLSAAAAAEAPSLTTVPTPGTARTRPWSRRAARALVAVAIATPHRAVISRVDGTRLPGASSPVSIRCRTSAAIRAYGGSF